MLQKPVMQHRGHMLDMNAHALNSQVQGAEMPGTGNNSAGGILISGGKAYSRENVANYRNGLGLTNNGMVQYSLRHGPPQQQAQMFQTSGKAVYGSGQGQKMTGPSAQQTHHKQIISMNPLIQPKNNPASGYASALVSDTHNSA